MMMTEERPGKGNKRYELPHKDFARRFHDVCEGHPLVPQFNQGRLTWIRNQLELRFGISVSRETIRKWYSGVTIPRHNKLTALAELLGVDEGWLAFGIHPDIDVKQRPARKLAESGATNVVAGLIQLSGGHCAIPDPDDPNKDVDIYAIIDGRQRNIAVCLAKEDADDQVRFEVPNGYARCIVIGVIVRGVGYIDMYLIPGPLIERLGTRRGAFIEVAAIHKGRNWTVGGYALQQITDVKRDLSMYAAGM